MPLHGDQQAVGVSLLVNLTELNLSGNRISALDGLESLQALVTLDMSHNLVSSISEVAKLAKNKSLTVLILEGNPLANKT